MKRTSRELKSLSRECLLGNYGIVILSYFLVSIIISIITSPFQSQLNDYSYQIAYGHFRENFPLLAIIGILIIGLASILLYAGISKLQLCLARHESVNVALIFSQFKQRPDRFIIYGLVFGLLEIILFIPATVLFIVSVTYFDTQQTAYGFYFLYGGIALFIIGFVLAIFFSIRFSASMFIMIDHPETGCFSAMKKSFELTHGHAGRLLYIYLSFIPMGILVGLSFGIAGFWVMPYFENTLVWFYLDISGELDRKIEEARRMDEEMGPVLDDGNYL